MPDEVNAICRFYADQYGMIITTIYDPVFFVLKCHIVFGNTMKNISIRCAGLSDKEIVEYFHTIIYDVLAEEGEVLT
jgi:hypothetical protein